MQKDNTTFHFEKNDDPELMFEQIRNTLPKRILAAQKELARTPNTDGIAMITMAIIIRKKSDAHLRN